MKVSTGSVARSSEFHTFHGCRGPIPNGDVSNKKIILMAFFFKFTAVELSSGGCEAAASLHLQNQVFVFVQYLDEDLKVAGKYKGNDYSQYSPWSCDTIGSYIGTKDAKPKDVVAARSVEMAVCRGTQKRS